MEPVKVGICPEIVQEYLFFARFDLLKVLAIRYEVQKLVEYAKEYVPHFDSEPFVIKQKVLVIDLLEGRVEFGTFEVLESGKRAQDAFLVFQLWEVEVVGEATIDVADCDVLLSPIFLFEVLEMLHCMTTSEYNPKRRAHIT